MIIRTYQRRNRSGRSLSDSGNLHGDGVGSSGSQESLWGSSQEPAPFSFPSQETCWSQSDYGNSTSSFKSTRRQSYDDDFGDDGAMGMLSGSPISRSISEKPPLDLAKRNGDGTPSKGKLKKAQSDFQDLFLNGTKSNFSRELDRRRSDIYETDSQENGAGRAKPKRGSVWADAVNNASLWDATAPPTSTLMETQESGEMMEHVDEANFALDGLRQGQPVRIQRASLTSLLSLCGSVQRRRMLRTHGMAKPLLDAIVALPTDDPPLALAAAAVLYFLAIDSQDEDLLDSEACVLFLMKLLGAQSSQPVVKKGLSAIGSRLAALSKSAVPKIGPSLVGVDRGAAVVTKVRELFKTLQEHGPEGKNPSEDNGILLGEEISSKWLALLTLEKACISTVILEDSTAEAVRKVGGRFKERLRELGGLDAVCELAASCLVNLTEALKTEDAAEIVELNLASLEKNEKSGGIGVLLRCLRVMENVTFLSEQNQKHLLELKLSRGKVSGTDSFIGLTINAINTLSELARRQKERKDGLAKQLGLASFACSEKGKPVTKLSPMLENKASSSVLKGDNRRQGKRQRSLAECFRATESAVVNGKWESEKAERSRSGNNIASSLLTFKRRRSPSLSLSQEKLELSERSQGMSVVSTDSKDRQAENQTSRKMERFSFLRKSPVSKVRVSQTSGTGSDENESAKLSNDGLNGKANKGRSKDRKPPLDDSQEPFAFDAMDTVFIKGGGVKQMNSISEDSQDPFAFDDSELDFKSYKMTQKKPKREQVVGKSKSLGHAKKASKTSSLETTEDFPAMLEKSDLLDGSEGSARGDPESQDEGSKKATLLGDCLLSGVKVLMNLTNGNPVGCSQVATCGGFNSLSSLLISNYPWPRSPVLHPDSSMVAQSQGDQEMEAIPNRQSDGDLEEDLDLLVTVLGVLCNLVEKDVSNRARLASLKVAVPPDIASTTEGKLWQETGMIGLLCSLFLMKQGAGEAAEAIESKRALEMDEEVKQGQAEAEDMIVEAYTALLLAFLSKESDRARMGIAHLLPGNDLKTLVPVLERFVAFHLSLNMLSEETHAVVRDVIDSCKQPISSRSVA